SSQIPQALAIQGISKISPKIGNFLKRGQDQGLNVQDGLNFIKEQILSSQEQPDQAQQPSSKNIIEQYSPELYQTVRDFIQKGEHPIRAMGMALSSAHVGDKAKKYSDIMNKILKDSGRSWTDIIDSV